MSHDDSRSYEPPPLGSNAVGLSDERQIADELRILDPQLAGLYEQALRLLTKVSEPGVAYFVAHAGRELSRGLVRRLLSEEETYVPLDQVDDDERNRATIAGILQLPTISIVSLFVPGLLVFAALCLALICYVLLPAAFCDLPLPQLAFSS